MTQKQIYYFNSYDVLKLSNKEWNDDIRKHYIMYKQLKKLKRSQNKTSTTYLQTIIIFGLR